MVNDIREYRGKCIKTDMWVYGSLVVMAPPLQCFKSEVEEPKYYIAKAGFADWNMPRPMETVEVDGDTVGQYIGLKDKNKQNIYEGQLVFDEDDKYLVVWNEKQAGYQLNLYGPGMYHNESGGEEWTNDDRDLGYAGIDMDVVSVMEIVKEADDK